MNSSIFYLGRDYTLSDEATDHDELGSPSGWTMFIELDGDMLTAHELRGLADKMDEAARNSGRQTRHDV